MSDQHKTERAVRTAQAEMLRKFAYEYKKHESREAALLSGLCALALLARIKAIRSEPHLADRVQYWRNIIAGEHPLRDVRDSIDISPLQEILDCIDLLMSEGSTTPESELGPMLTYSLAIEHVSQKPIKWWDEQQSLLTCLVGDEQRICELATELVFKSWRTALSSRARNQYEYGPYPQSLGTLLARLLGPERSEVLYDPTVGTGSLLFYLSQHQGAANHEFCGQDINESMARFAEFVIRLNGGNASFPSLDVFSEGGLPVEIRGSLPDIVLLDPPWGHRLRQEQEEVVIRTSALLRDDPRIRAVSSEMAYLLHGIESCNRDRGRVAALLPQGVSFRRGSDQLMRRLLTERSWIPLRAVISLPPMMAYTLAAPVLLIFDARQGAGKVLFVDASNKDGLEDYELRQDTIDQIVRYYQEGSEKHGVSKWVDRSEVAQMDYTWEVKRYVHPVAEFEGPTADEMRDRVATIELKLKDSQVRLDFLLRRLSSWAGEPQQG